jgi:uncharacterized glyoxalase superfamily protein PhnB
MLVQPYLFFEGRCEEAIAFYQRTLGAEVTMLMRFKDSPEPPPPGMVPPGSEDKVMHASLRIGETTDRQDVLLAALRHRRRPFRRLLDDRRGITVRRQAIPPGPEETTCGS